MEKIDISFIVNGKFLYTHGESSFVPRKGDFLKLHGKKYQVNYVEWVIHKEDGFYVMIYLNPSKQS